MYKFKTIDLLISLMNLNNILQNKYIFIFINLLFFTSRYIICIKSRKNKVLTANTFFGGKL